MPVVFQYISRFGEPFQEKKRQKSEWFGQDKGLFQEQFVQLFSEPNNTVNAVEGQFWK